MIKHVRRRHLRRRLCAERYEPRLCLSEVAFATHEIEVEQTALGARCVRTADLDGDGDLDMLSGSWEDGKIAWYENTDGAGTFGPQQVITTAAFRLWSVYAADLDGDGDLDVLSASRRLDSEWGGIAWYENTDGDGTFGPGKVISTGHGNGIAYVADLDGDGDLDVLSPDKAEEAVDGENLVWHENIDGAGNFGPAQVIDTPMNGGFMSLHAADLDGDGDQDILAGSSQGYPRETRIVWYENIVVQGQRRFIPYHEFAWGGQSASVFVVSLDVADLDGDGDPDVLAGSNSAVDDVSWYENTDGAGHFGREHVITTNVDHLMSVHAADLDGDGDLDVLSASDFDDKIAWYENTDGAGTFGATTDHHTGRPPALGMCGRSRWRWRPGCALGIVVG